MEELIVHFLPFLKERIGGVKLDHKYIGSVLKHIHVRKYGDHHIINITINTIQEIRDAPNLRDLADRLVYFFVFPDLGDEGAVAMLEKIKVKNQIDSKGMFFLDIRYRR